MEGKVRLAFKQYLDGVRSKPVLDRISAMLERGDIEGALRLIDPYIARLGSVVPQIISAVGAEEAASLGSQLMRWSPHMAASFDPSYPRAAELIRRERLQFIREFGQEQKAAVRQAISRGFQQGTGVRPIARNFRETIGLTRYQESVIANYRAALEAGSRDAVERALRDRRFDRTVMRSINEGEPLSAKQIDTMVDRYRAGWLRHRSETIARTEAVRATGLAREEATKQSVEDLGLPQSRIRRTWVATGDARTRDAHAAMQVSEVGLDEPFIDGDGNRLMFPGDPAAPPATTANCRCGVQITVLPPEQTQ